MKSKEQVIKESWIAEIGEEKYNDVKHLIDKEGYLDNSDEKTYLTFRDFKKEKTVDYYDNEIIRLKSLNNISNNNGWNRIDEVGLPPTNIELVWLNTEDGIFEAKPKVISDPMIKDYWLKTATHWQEIKKPKPPIY